MRYCDGFFGQGGIEREIRARFPAHGVASLANPFSWKKG